FRRQKLSNALLRDRYVHPDVGEIVKRDDVLGPHPDATETGRFSDSPFFRRPVDINATIVGGAVLLFFPAQPNYARDDRVSPGGIWIDNLAGRDTALDHRSRRQMIAEPSRNEQRAQRSAISPDSIADPELGSGNGKAHDDFAAIEKCDLLIGH